ncbi:hypothetical protein ABZS71_06650 [Streptomyces sp. NPDC005393]|uniref:hypothetical protein n=1 Tax=Streptomyces sp. NPDC005393 TaxID=3157041 RepID=UPI0033AAE9CD
MENTSPLSPDVPPRPSGAPTVHVASHSTDSPNGWRDEYQNHPEYQRILAGVERPWWKRPVALWGGVVAVAVGSFYLGGAVLGSGDSSGTSSPDPWVQGQLDDQSQNNQPAGLTYQEKQQILFKFCTSSQMRGEPGDSSAFPTCMASYEVTDQGMVMPK